MLLSIFAWFVLTSMVRPGNLTELFEQRALRRLQAASIAVLKDFLRQHKSTMPATAKERDEIGAWMQTVYIDLQSFSIDRLVNQTFAVFHARYSLKTRKSWLENSIALEVKHNLDLRDRYFDQAYDKPDHELYAFQYRVGPLLS